VEGRLIESVVDHMIAVLDELGCERVVVLDASGPTALQFARAPRALSTAVKISATSSSRITSARHDDQLYTASSAHNPYGA
jgi:hypothetical protein